jgi:high-affinity Fe2+/Pb2+ permease
MEPKVKIGCAYQRSPHVEDDPDMILLQKALLGERDDTTPLWVCISLWALFLLIIILIFVWG